jgi:PAS domain S-box-containing protein
VYRIHEVDSKTFNPTVDSGVNFYAPGSKPIIALAVKKAIELGESFDLELEIITAKGNYRFVRAVGQTEQIEGKTKKVYGVFQDITDRKKSEEKYKILFETSQDAIMVLEPPDWRFTSGNIATLKLFGLESVKQLQSLGPADLSPEYQSDGQLSLDKAKEMIELAIKNGFNYFEWTHKQYQGSDFFATVSLTKVKIGNDTFIQATVRDITKEKEKLNELARINRILVGRELRMIELKEKIKKYENKD